MGDLRAGISGLARMVSTRGATHYGPVGRETFIRQRGQATRVRVLIVDDHDSFRVFARSLLEAEGCDVVAEAADGRSALVGVAEARPDLVLLDIQLPDMDGFEVTHRLLGGLEPLDRPVPVVVLTSTRDPADFGRRIEESGAAGFVAKADLSKAALDAVVGGGG